MEHGILAGREAWNWQNRDNLDEYRREYLSAALRHLGAVADPSESDLDPDSSCHHLSHAAASILILLWKLDEDYRPSKLVAPPPPLETMAEAYIRQKWMGKHGVAGTKEP
jgi:hypothetical protein